MKTIRWFMLCMVALFTMPTAYAQETTDESINTATAAVEETSATNMNYISVDKLFDTLKEYENAEYIEVNSFMMGMAKMMAPREEKEFLKKIKNMRIIELSDCSDTDKARFAKYITNTELTSFEPGVDQCDDENEDEKMRIFIKIKGETITDMVVTSWGGQEYILMQISGKMNISDIEAVANGSGKSVL